jgi:hypothetical protein
MRSASLQQQTQKFFAQTSRDREKHRDNTRDTERTKANGRYDDGLPKAII